MAIFRVYFKFTLEANGSQQGICYSLITIHIEIAQEHLWNYTKVN